MTDNKLDQTKRYYYVDGIDDIAIEVTIIDTWASFYEVSTKDGFTFHATSDQLIEKEIYNTPLYKALREN